ncbi:villin 4 [Artemisia annua]|uniref:Villin 4 n=1 Tax=Artemisia annua TaxID=35608 RepID=A0A2U1KBJ3_ARTAN|nr:villin 4 [Artemisia annua]
MVQMPRLLRQDATRFVMDELLEDVMFSIGKYKVEAKEYKIRMFTCQGKHFIKILINRWWVPSSQSSLNYDDIFILDAANKIFQFNGSNSCIQERAKALEVGNALPFSVPEGIKVPSSLMNMYQELQQDLGCSILSQGNLEQWVM